MRNSIEFLSLDACRGEDVNGYEMLKTIMNACASNKFNKLATLNLPDNNISTGGDTFISDFLARNKAMYLSSLDLTENELDDNDAVAIAGALKHNKHLRNLEIADNNLTSVGWEALSKAVLDKTSLNTIVGSNHTCIIDFPMIFEDVKEVNGDNTSDNYCHPTYVKHKKIYSVLSSRNRESSNVKHFENVPVEILPDLLECFEFYSNYSNDPNMVEYNRHVHPLSLVYEICRHFEEALAVFESLSLNMPQKMPQGDIHDDIPDVSNAPTIMGTRPLGYALNDAILQVIKTLGGKFTYVYCCCFMF